MLPTLFRVTVLALPLALAVPSAPAAAQERGENINGFVTRVDGRDVVVKNDDGREIRIRVSPSTELYFQDSGDRKLFPNPTIDDLRAGMGVHFNYNDGRPDRIVVHFVPEGYVRPSTTPTAEPRREEVRGRILALDRQGRSLTARVDGGTRTYALRDRGLASGFRGGDLVVMTVEHGADGAVVTRIERGDLVGTVRQVDARRGTVVINVDGRDRTYYVENDKLLEAISKGTRVRFEVEEHGGRPVIVAMERRPY